MNRVSRQIMEHGLAALLGFCALGVASARGQGCPPQYTQNFDGVQPPALPAGWTATQGMNVTGAPLWITSTIASDTPPNAAFSTAPDNVLDNRLDTPALNVGSFDFSGSFWHSYNLEGGFDGAVLEISNPSINGGAFTDVTDPTVGGHFAPGTGYNTTISAASQSPIAGRMAWGGNSNGFVRCALTFGMPFNPGFFGSTILRFRLVTDDSGASGGWRVDTFVWDHSECNPPSPTPAPLPTATPSPTPTPTPTPTTTPVPTSTPTPTASPLPRVQPLNISTRLRVETGDKVLIGGFVITGNAPKKVALRGVGPSLANFGLSDVLADPTLELRASDGALLMQNDNWQDDSAQAAQLMALGLAPGNPNEAGIVASLQPGAYTAILAGKNLTSGIGLVEVYDADPTVASQLANISTRGFVRSGDNVMIGGFILDNGGASTAVAVRGMGPSLSQFGLSNVLADPILELRDGNGALLIANDNWQDDAFGATQLSANGLAPQNPLESGIFTTLPPGLFTVILAGKNGGVGLGLVEVYCNVQAPTRIVTNTFPSGPGSLVQTLADANNGDTIRFDPSLYGRSIVPHVGVVIDKDIVISGFGPDHTSIVQDVHISVLIIEPDHKVLLEGLTIRGGRARVAGGGINNEGSTLILNNCAVESNTSDGSAGGIFQGGPRLTIINSAIMGNSITGTLNPVGGGIYGGGIIEIRNSTISGNFVSNGTTLGGLGGGIVNGGTMTISNSTVRNNSASGGAGILNYGPLTITNSTVSGNTAFPGVQGTGNSGGGIVNSGPLTIANTTISGNSAARGGAIANGGPLTIAYTTVSDNQTDAGSGSIHNSGSLEIGNSILKSGSAGANIFNSSGTVISHGYNLSSDNGAGFLTASGDQTNTNPLLGPLRNNGGPTFTHALLTGSPAINAGDPNFVPPPSYDQRGPGYPRVIGGRIDIGSFEVQPSSKPTPTP